MIRTHRHRPHFRRRTKSPIGRASWDCLESRIAMAAVIGTIPASGSTLRSSPESFRIRFDVPIDSFSLGFADVVIQRLNDDGSVVPAFDEFNLPYEDVSFDDASELVLTPSTPLGPGRYRFTLSGMSGLMDINGEPAFPVDGIDQALADFTVARPGVGLSDAVDLGTVGPWGLSVEGSLDFTSNPSDVKLYKFVLPRGHNWRLGTEVTAQREGSSLNSALTLFDSTGRPLETSELGRSDAPFDPFLFAGLRPGTYYVGVSGTGDLPGNSGSYNVANSSPGLAQSQPGGDFTLHLVADEADLPGALIDFRVNHADPLDPTPTGFALRFSTPLDLGGSGSEVFNTSTGSIHVVDAKGRAWAVAAVNYDAEHAALSFLLLDRLPEGHYTIRMDAEHPLVDLAGIVPTSPTMPKGVLATFAVAPDLRARAADGSLPVPAYALKQFDLDKAAVSEDIGPLTPNLAIEGFERTFTLQPGESAVLRFVSLFHDFYRIAIRREGGPVSVEMEEAGRKNVDAFDLDPSGLVTLTDLEKSEYVARFRADGDTPVTVTIRLSIGSFSWDSLLANGLGQGPALNLRLVSTDGPANFALGDGARSTPQAPGSIATGPSAGPFAEPTRDGNASNGQGRATASPIPAALTSVLTGALASRETIGPVIPIGGNPVGRPTRESDHVAAVGPGSGEGSFALASNAVGAGQALTETGSGRGVMSEFEDASPGEGDPAQVPAPNTEGAIAPKDDSIAKAGAPVVEGDHVPEAVTSPVTSPSTDGAASEPLLALDADQASEKPIEEDAEEKSVVLPWVAALLGISAIGVRWMRRRAVANQARLTIATRVIPAPHATRSRVRV